MSTRASSFPTTPGSTTMSSTAPSGGKHAINHWVCHHHTWGTTDASTPSTAPSGTSSVMTMSTHASSSPTAPGGITMSSTAPSGGSTTSTTGPDTTTPESTAGGQHDVNHFYRHQLSGDQVYSGQFVPYHFRRGHQAFNRSQWREHTINHQAGHHHIWGHDESMPSTTRLATTIPGATTEASTLSTTPVDTSSLETMSTQASSFPTTPGGVTMASTAPFGGKHTINHCAHHHQTWCHH
ncbi:Mucin-17 [Plecturocebus cupreus]